MPAPSKAELRKQRGKEQITCECGSTLSRNGLTRHKKSWTHYKIMQHYTKKV
jgi:hypothetical protein